MFAIVDIETCGSKFAFRKGRIIEICILIHDGMSVVDKYSTLINPECYISGFYTQISGITNEMVADAPKFHEVAKEIIAFTEGKIFVAHNAAFDYHFVRDEFASMGYTFRRETLCTVRLSRKLIPGKKSYSLGNLCSDIGIQIENRHRAEGDAVATAKLLDILLQLKTQSKEYKTKSVTQIMTTKVQNIKKYIVDKLPESCGVYYFLNKEGQIIYIGKSVNMYSRALSHYNTDLKKSKAMLQDIHDVDFVETGSELISLLLESQEIKKHQPIYNRQRKKEIFTHAIDFFTDEQDIINLRIVPFEDSQNALLSFNHYTTARERLEQWIDEKELCLRYCGLTTEGSVCFHHQIKKCRGICAEQESIQTYNERVNTVVTAHTFPKKDFIILDKGRTHDEKSFILVQDYTYIGYGYLEENMSFTTIDDFCAHIETKQRHPDEHEIVRAWLKQQKNPRMISFS